MFFLPGHLSAFGAAVPLVFHGAWASVPRGHAPRSVTAGGGEAQEGGERLPRKQVCWCLAGIPGGTQGCGDALTAPGRRGAGGHLQVLPAQRSWQKALRGAGGGPPGPPPPHVQQLSVLARSTSARPHCSRERACVGPMTSLFSRRERPWWEEGQGTQAGTLGVGIFRAAVWWVHLGPRHSTIPFPFMPSKKKKLL